MDPNDFLRDIPNAAYRVVFLETFRDTVQQAIEGAPVAESELGHVMFPLMVNGALAVLLRNVCDEEIARCTPA